MSEEIKEILDRLDFNEWEVDLYKVPITWTELYDVRDYITNLQQKVEQLEKENKILKEDNVFLKNNLSKLSKKYIKNDLLNILNKGSNKE